MKSLNNFSKIDIQTLAGYILKYFGPMSHLKLQKLLYYCQAYHLAYFEEPLFEEDFEAWVHGPVCRDVYNILKGKSVLYSDVSYDKYDFNSKKLLKSSISSDQFTLVNDVLNTLNQWTGGELEQSTHKDAPWNIARKELPPNHPSTNIIDKKIMLDFYKKEVNEWED